MRRAALLAGPLAVLLAVPALADPTPTPTAPEPEDLLAVSVTDLLPRAPEAGQAFEVMGAIRNRSSTETVTDPRVRLARGNVITSRGGLHESQRDPADLTRTFTSRPLTSRPKGGGSELTSLAPGEVGYFDIRTDVDSLALSRTGVYPFAVQARGSVDGSGLQLLGAVPTWVPFFAADTNPRQTKVAVVWPVVDRPHQAPDASFVDDDLATSFAKGPLQHMLYAASFAAQPVCDGGAVRNDGVRDPGTTRCDPVPVTYAVDPDLVSAADLMANADHYEVGTGKRKTQGKGKRAAGIWLDALKAQVADPSGSYLGLPFADPDVDALAGTPAGRDHLKDATTLGNQVLRSKLAGVPVRAVYPPSQTTGVLTQQAADALVPEDGQRFAFVLDESAFPDLEDDGRNRSPSAPVTLATPTPLYALVADDVLSTLVLGGTSAEEGSRLAEQRFIAETAIIAAEAPGLSRTFLVAPDRYSDADVRTAADALRDIGRLPWLCPVTVQEATQGTESCPRPRSDAERTSRPDSDDPRTTLRTSTDGLLPAPYLEAVATDQRRATQLTTEVLDPEPAQDRVAGLRTQLKQAVARAESAAWRADPAGRELQLRELDKTVNLLVGGVNVFGGRLLLTSDKGTIQVSLTNALDLPVQVSLKFTFPGGTVTETPVITVPGKKSVPASIKAEGLRSGKFLVLVQMHDRSGHAFRGTVKVEVRSTRYGRLALGVTFAAAAVLFLAAGTRILRRSLRRGPAPE